MVIESSCSTLVYACLFYFSCGEPLVIPTRLSIGHVECLKTYRRPRGYADLMMSSGLTYVSLANRVTIPRQRRHPSLKEVRAEYLLDEANKGEGIERGRNMPEHRIVVLVQGGFSHLSLRHRDTQRDDTFHLRLKF